MPFFYEQKENETEQIITYKNQPLFYIVLLVVFGLTFFDFGYVWQYGLLGAFVVFLVFWIVGNWKVNKIVRKAMKKGEIQVTGSKLSFKNPVIVKIKKIR
ncbi:hypothetical protein COT97_03590 [Candidatus Falkowbacteria bacterium CG10_big_fil_rev_8_21_14_0_10_39_11]|uniref:Uncharacterized protein n=1 Tax=Candidatus Falkowbacteria bacterium CG10_big_fil_rev_8_21_14_0_10_39_11 TaxID=1974565 RepID=A0A2H0V4L9_9BACT|nr:MAG: hypothetical protein COT97_03590 [Candidatus Falkowbacteria bacterium CG10_big_fil_rev_8_21_14_0_10_39_11]